MITITLNYATPQGAAEAMSKLAREDNGPSYGQALRQAQDWQLVLNMIASGTQKIEAIKQVRAMTGLGLKEAKDLVGCL